MNILYNCILATLYIIYALSLSMNTALFVCAYICVVINFMGFSYIIFLLFSRHIRLPVWFLCARTNVFVKFLVFLHICRTAYGLVVRSMWLSVTAIHEPDHRTSGRSCLKLARWRCPSCKARGESHG